MAITDAEIPEILDFGEVFDHKEVVLIGLGDTIGCLTRTCQICKLSNLIFDFTMSLLRRRGLLWNLRFVRRVGNVSHGCAALLPLLLIVWCRTVRVGAILIANWLVDLLISIRSLTYAVMQLIFRRVETHRLDLFNFGVLIGNSSVFLVEIVKILVVIICGSRFVGPLCRIMVAGLLLLHGLQ